MDGAASSQHAQGIPTPSMAGSRSVEGVPSVDAVSSPAAQGIPNAEVTGALPGTDMPCPHANSPPARIISMPETSEAVPAEGIPGRIAVTLPVFGVARSRMAGHTWRTGRMCCSYSFLMMKKPTCWR